jgi:hypothetical protein
MKNADSPFTVPAEAYQEMSALVTSHWIPQVIRAGINLGVPEHLAEASLTAGEIADREGSAPATTFRLLRACVVIGLLTAGSDGRFRGTPLLRTLHKDAPGSLRGLALATTLPGQWLAWNAFTASVRKGGTQVSQALGTDFFSYLEDHPDEAHDFSQGLTSHTAQWTSTAAQVIDTDGVRVAVDIGGAEGALLHLLMADNREMRGIVFDRPNVVAAAVEETARRGLSDRTEVIGGDFFSSVPSADLYLLKMILHDWDDENCVAILRNIAAAMNPGARVAVVEMLIGELGDPGPAALMDMNMLAVVPGQERSLAEYDALLSAAGLRRVKVTPTGSGQSVIESVSATAVLEISMNVGTASGSGTLVSGPERTAVAWFLCVDSRPAVGSTTDTAAPGAGRAAGCGAGVLGWRVAGTDQRAAPAASGLRGSDHRAAASVAGLPKLSRGQAGGELRAACLGRTSWHRFATRNSSGCSLRQARPGHRWQPNLADRCRSLAALPPFGGSAAHLSGPGRGTSDNRGHLVGRRQRRRHGRGRGA